MLISFDCKSKTVVSRMKRCVLEQNSHFQKEFILTFLYSQLLSMLAFQFDTDGHLIHFKIFNLS